MEYVTERFENSSAGIARKDAYSKRMAAQGYRIISEQIEAGHYKGGEACCLFLICTPCVFLTGRTPGTITVTYGRDVNACPVCNNPVLAGTQCQTCAKAANNWTQEAANRTAEAQKKLKGFETLLTRSIALDYRFNWKTLAKQYSIPAPQLGREPSTGKPPLLVRLALFVPALERILPPLSRYRQKWEEDVAALRAKRAADVERFNGDFRTWEQSKISFEKDEQARAEQKRQLYLSKDQGALLDYWTRVFATESTSIGQPVRFDTAERKLIVSCSLPTIDVIPKIQEVKYDQSKHQYLETSVPSERRNVLYADLLITIALTTLYKLFQSDVAEALTSVTFNGTVTTLDQGTGRDICPCVISVEAQKSTFMQMDLSRVNITACFNRLSGRISENLREFVPVDPVSN